MTIHEIAHRLGARRSGAGYMACCPAHEDKDPSLSLNEKNGKLLVHCHAGCSQDQVIVALRQLGLWPENKKKAHARIVAVYDYLDEHGDRLYQIVRKEPKCFYPRYRGPDGRWIYQKAKRQVLYRLPEVLSSQHVVIVEGEKDVESLRSRGIVATTNAGGAYAPWLPEYTECLRGKRVTLIPDSDRPGLEQGLRIARALLGQASGLALMTLEGVKDITEWFELGRSAEQIYEALKDGMA